MEWFQKIRPRRVTRHTATTIIVTKNGKTVTVTFSLSYDYVTVDHVFTNSIISTEITSGYIFFYHFAILFVVQVNIRHDPFPPNSGIPPFFPLIYFF